MFESILLLLHLYDGPMFVGEDYNCTLEPRLERSFVSPTGRHDSLALRRLLGRAQLSDVLDDDIEIAEAERAMTALRRRFTLISTICRAVVRQVNGWIGGR